MSVPGCDGLWWPGHGQELLLPSCASNPGVQLCPGSVWAGSAPELGVPEGRDPAGSFALTSAAISSFP